MTALVMIRGTLVGAPQKHIAKEGQPFVFARLKSMDGPQEIWNIATDLPHLQKELLTYHDGELIAVEGSLYASIVGPKRGKQILNLTCYASKFTPSPKRQSQQNAPYAQPLH